MHSDLRTTDPKKKGEPTEQFITEVTTTEAIASDLDGMQRNLQAQGEHHGDGATLPLHYREESDDGTELVHQFTLRIHDWA